MRDDSYQIIDNPEGYKRKVVPNLSTLCTQCAVSKAPDKIMERSVSDATRAGAAPSRRVASPLHNNTPSYFEYQLESRSRLTKLRENSATTAPRRPTSSALTDLRNLAPCSCWKVHLIIDYK